MLGAELMQQPAFADPALARQRIESEAADAVALKDDERGFNGFIAGDLRAGLVIHYR